MKRTSGLKSAAEAIRKKAGGNHYAARMINQILRESYRMHSRDRATRMAVKRCLG